MIDTSSPDRCRDVECRQPIYWRTIKGRREAYDPPKDCTRCGGNGGTTFGARFEQCALCRGRGKVQVRHAATCAAAYRFRRREMVQRGDG